MNWLRRDHSASKEDYMVLSTPSYIHVPLVVGLATPDADFAGLFSGPPGALTKAVWSSCDCCSKGLSGGDLL